MIAEFKRIADIGDGISGGGRKRGLTQRRGGRGEEKTALLKTEYLQF
jgi:hypothetical protein